MESLLDRFRRERAGGLRRSRSVRASLRLTSRHRDDTPLELDKLKRNSVVFSTQIWSSGGERELAPPAPPGSYCAAPSLELRVKPLPTKLDKSKFSDLFSNKKQKAASARELLPEKMPAKAAAILQPDPPAAGKKKLKGFGKSESATSMAELAAGRVNPAFLHTPPSPAACLKLQYGALLEGCGGELAALAACAPRPRRAPAPSAQSAPPAPLAPPREPLAQVNIHLQALLGAVERGQLEAARTAIEALGAAPDVSVNSAGADGLAALAVAELLQHAALVRLLLVAGARAPPAPNGSAGAGGAEGGAELGALLRRRLGEAEAQLAAGGDAAPVQHWERRVRTLRRLLAGWQQLRAPPAPPAPALDVTGPAAACLRLSAPPAPAPPASYVPLTRYKVEWSARADFSNICGSREVSAAGTGEASEASEAGEADESDETSVAVSGLTRGRRYFFRVAAGNLKGWSDFVESVPRSVVPSSWRDVAGAPCAPEGDTCAALERLALAVAAARPAPPAPPRLPRKKTATIRQLFTAASKFQKNLRRGVYLACVLYHGERVLVTSEEVLPAVAVDDAEPAALQHDFHWLMKVSCAWGEVRALRAELAARASSSLHFRLKLLTAAHHMQAALALTDLGQLFHSPLRDAHGTLVLSCVRDVRAPKAVSALNARWLAAGRLRRRVLGDDHSAGELLLASVPEQLAYHRALAAAPPRGLCAAVLQLRPALDAVRLVVPARAPALPPLRRLRANPHVSAEEWEYLQRLAEGKAGEGDAGDAGDAGAPTEAQRLFARQVAAGVRRLLRDVAAQGGAGAGDGEGAEEGEARLYRLAVLELSADLSLLLVCPPAGRCGAPGDKELLLQRTDLLALPVQAFELLHLRAFRPALVARYAALSVALELGVALAAQAQREAFSSAELSDARTRLAELERLQAELTATWRAARWLPDLLGFARDKAEPGAGLSLSRLLGAARALGPADEAQRPELLQLPARDGKLGKAAPGRGSWPGPAAAPAGLHAELSKSEQRLGPRHASTQDLASPAPPPARPALPPSRSEVALAAQAGPRADGMSTTSSPLLAVKGYYAGSMINVRGARPDADSAHSLSSDSETHSAAPAARPAGSVTPSKSMTNVKSDAVEGEAGGGEATEGEEDGAGDAGGGGETARGGILQVFAAYDTGLAAGTSLKLHVTPRTSAREVIDLVVTQLNVAAALRGAGGPHGAGAPLYAPRRLPDFCLVAVIGARERCLRDDFRPLALQNPWRRGRLYVRLRRDVLAALRHARHHDV